MAHWEEYHTGVMSYGNGLWGVTEANYAVVALHFYTWTVGPQGWTSKPFDYLLANANPEIAAALPPAVLKFLVSLRFNDLFLIVFSFFGFSLFRQQTSRVIQVASNPQLKTTLLSPKEVGNKTLGGEAAVWHLLQILGTCACGAALMSLPTSVSGEGRVLMATFGVTYALQATRLIMAHMSKEPFTVAAWPLVLMLGQVANYYLGNVLDPVLLAYSVNAVVIAGYLHYVIGMINEICEYLGIKALTIKPNID